MIGRREEIRELRRRLDSNQPEFVAVYGRRRIGKTFLINEVFGSRFAFHHAGMEKGDKRMQLESFREALVRQGLVKCPVLKSWIKAFSALEDLLDSLPEGRKIVFLDELPWYDTPKSGFLPAFESFWNAWACLRKDIMLIVCGSATSWIIRKVLKSRGGLYNRVTKQIPLQPFTLKECEEYAAYKHLGYDRQQILDCYMALGGVAYYWSLLEEGKSSAQNFDSLFFGPMSAMRDEYANVFRSLFKNPTRHFEVIGLFGGSSRGLTREEIVAGLGETSSGDISECLEELTDCGFLRRFGALGTLKKGATYQLVDNYTLFYCHFLRARAGNDGRFWTISQNKPRVNAWKGLAFERVCMQHVEQIKRALGISGILADVYSWHCPSLKPGEPGAQIDMLIDRDDRMINLCEIKYSSEEYELKEDERKKLSHRIELFREVTGTKKGLNLTMITTCGVKRNRHSGIVQSQVTLDDLFSS